jgi:hypothetical protein
MMKRLDGAGKDTEMVYDTEMEALKTLHIDIQGPTLRETTSAGPRTPTQDGIDYNKPQPLPHRLGKDLGKDHDYFIYYHKVLWILGGNIFRN